MKYWEIFVAFFIPGILGYGGGPSSIPLVQHEVVNRFGWLTMDEFANILALGNMLPGPIATKMAGYIGYEEGGLLGSLVAIGATVLPSLLAMMLLFKLIYKHKDSPKVKRMTNMIRPVIAILLAGIALDFLLRTWGNSGGLQAVGIAVVSFFLLEKIKVHPAFVILLAMGYGAFILV